MTPKYTITQNNLKIIRSCDVPKARFETVLKQIRGLHPESLVWTRELRSLCREWAVHNFFFSLGIAKSHTEDVDLNYPNRWEWLYNIIGWMVWGKVK